MKALLIVAVSVVVVALLAVGAGWWFNRTGPQLSPDADPRLPPPSVVTHQDHDGAAATSAAAPSVTPSSETSKTAAAFEKAFDGGLPDSRVREDLKEKGYPLPFIDELLLLRREMKAANVTPEQIRNATAGGAKEREKFSKALPQNVQRQVIRTIRAMLMPDPNRAKVHTEAAGMKVPTSTPTPAPATSH